MTETAPAGDGYDIFSPGYRIDPYSHWAALRESGCRLVQSDLWGGSWMPLTYEDIHTLARDTARLSSRSGEVSGPVDHAGMLFLPPLTSDPPDHKPHRDLLMPFFLPGRMAALEPFVRARARALAEAMAGAGGGEAVEGFSQELTLAVLEEMLGLPEGGPIADWVVRFMRVGPQEQAVRSRVIVEMLGYLDRLLRERAGSEGDDVISALGRVAVDGEPLSHRHQLGAAFLMLIAGADTTWSAIGSSLWHLGTVPSDCARLVAEPALIPTAVEELLRVYAPVTMGRRATCDFEFAGRTVGAGERVILPFGSANRDPEVFDDSDRVRLDRHPNRHVTFGSGPHRCLGAPLARMELRVALEEWLRVIPRFELVDPHAVDWSGGQVRGPVRLDVRVR